MCEFLAIVSACLRGIKEAFRRLGEPLWHSPRLHLRKDALAEQ